MSELREAFIRTLKLDDEHIIAPNHSHLFAAIGSALNSKRNVDIPLQTLQNRLANKIELDFEVERLEPLFASSAEYDAFTSRHAKHQVPIKDLVSYRGKAFLGIDAGSTTTKAALVGEDGTLLYSFYHNNDGDPSWNNNLCDQRYLQPAARRCRNCPFLFHRIWRSSDQSCTASG